MIQRAFQHRSGRVISLSRLVLALVFFLAVWIDPMQPARDEAIGYPLLLAYLIGAGILLAVSWSNWWADFRLARVAHVVDMAVFLVAIYFTEGYTSTFTSPFFTFFAFLLLSATLRWGWRAAAMTAIVATLLYFLLGLVMQAGGPDFDPYRFGRRVTYLFVLSFVLIWFGINQHQAASRRTTRELEVTPGATRPPIETALEYARERTGASRALFAWWEKEEPWIVVSESADGAFREQRFGPMEMGSIVSGPAEEDPFLFDVERGRALYMNREGPERLTSIPQPVSADFARRMGIEGGLSIPVRALNYEGQLFLTGVPGLCCDDLKIGSSIGRAVAMACDRYSMMAMVEKAAANETRLVVARDLHDSVAQVLAGASFRLEALRNWIRAGNDPDPEIVAMKDALRTEQRHVRALIAKLRLGGDSLRPTDITQSLDELAQDLTRQWAMEFNFSAADGTVEGPAWFVHELRQLVREAAANAARHGQARNVSIGLSWDDRELRLVVTDDGSGLPTQDGSVRPWSIHERIKNLGGTLSLQSKQGGVELEIRLPREEAE